jgi:hypothetical protein
MIAQKGLQGSCSFSLSFVAERCQFLDIDFAGAPALVRRKNIESSTGSPPMKVLRESAYEAVPWKNGGGMTREILREPVDAPGFNWRLSLATVDAPGPFSAFDGYARTLVLVRGAGIKLSFAQHGGARLDSVGQMVSFDGAWQTRCELIGGPSTDLNLMVAAERAESTCHCIRVTAPEVIQTDGWTEVIICCLTGAVRLTDMVGRAEDLTAVDVARCFPSDGAVTCSLGGSAAAHVFIGAVRLLPVAR